ncbi:hypothetical protein FRC11_002654, partial [Ceratobasidium sp. 423]
MSPRSSFGVLHICAPLCTTDNNPRHRYFILLREEAMTECGYSDPTPYWDWTRDSTVEKFKNSEIFDNEKGFGGNGTGETKWADGSCVEDGPYAGLH